MAWTPALSQNALPPRVAAGDIISLETVDRHRQRHRKSNISILILRRLALLNSALPPDPNSLNILDINLMDPSNPLL